MNVECSVSLGELMDKIAILRIKNKNITNEDKLKNIRYEEELLTIKLKSLGLEGTDLFLKRLEEVNSLLWDIEDKIRDKERTKTFDQEFIELARSVYITNDKRFDIKNEINSKYGSSVKEVKSYAKY